MRRKDREMDAAFAYRIVDKCAWAALSMVCPDGTPYCVPLSIVRDEDAVYFHCAMQGKKIDALRIDPRVCIVCVGDTRCMERIFTLEYESAILTGDACEVTDAAEKTAALRLLCARYTPGNMENFDTEVERSLARTAVWRVSIHEITGKRKKYDRQGRELKYGRMEEAPETAGGG